MPCLSDPGQDAYYREQQNNEFAKAALCAVLAALSAQGRMNIVLEGIDWKEAGLAKSDLFAWWEHHQKLDAKRRAHEQAEREGEALKRSALEKLSVAERKALGLK